MEEVKKRNVKMVVEYDGTDYAGWQTQKNGLAVQQVIEEKLSILVVKRMKIVGSGRTDSGVHAMGQVFSVKARFTMDDERLLFAMNSLLPKDISIVSVETVDDDFHALRDSKWKRYRYFVYNSRTRSALNRKTTWFVPVGLNIKEMEKASKVLEGHHDFKSFQGRNSSVKTTDRNIISISIIKRDDGMIVFDVIGEGFLRNMVRIIVGTLIEVGRGEMKADEMKKILEAKTRKSAGPTAPSHGLFLVEVGYDDYAV